MKRRFKALGYAVSDKIGEGGFGSVYKATHILTDQLVAVKILHRNKSMNTDYVTRQRLRFERETTLYSQLNHPNIIPLLNKGELDGRLFAVFPFIDGVTLKQKIFSSGALPPIDAFNIMLQILDGLAQAHNQGIIHRDIKPANIMLTSKYNKTHATILDFGISTVIHSFRNKDFTDLTLTQESLGSPCYAAPEQLRGEECSTKTDLYLWGLTLIECLTGQPAVTENSVASAFHQQLTSTPHALPPSLAQHPVCTLLRQVLHKNPQQRLGNAGDLYQQLSQYDLTTLMSNVTHAQSNQVPLLVKRRKNQDATLITPCSIIDQGQTEKKQLTVMCIRISHSYHAMFHSRVSANDDMESYEQLFKHHKDQCISIAQRYGATRINALGDSLLCYFGYPHVADDDSRLAAKTALEVIQSMPENDSDKEPTKYLSTLHIGIHSGMVLIEHDDISEGKSVNIAMALSRQAKVNQILCSDATRQILKCNFDCETYIADNTLVDDLPFQTYLLKCERRSESSRITRKKKTLALFCLRHDEFTQLQNVLATDTSSQSIHIYGEAGIGKSWLVANFYLHCCNLSTLSGRTIIPLMVRCKSEEKHSCLHPIMNLLNHRYELTKLNLSQRIKKLSNLLCSSNLGYSQNTLSQLWSWLGFTPATRPSSMQLPPDKMAKTQVFNALCFLLCRLGQNDYRNKYVFIIEDTHYSDPVSSDFFTHLVSSAEFKKYGHCLYSTSRRTLTKGVDSLYSQQIVLNKLDEKQSQLFLSHIFNQQPVNLEVEQIIYELADGNPLYIQELAEALKRNKQIQVINGQIQFNSTNHKVDVPCSLRDQLQQKVDGLTNSKNVAQIASSMGNEFDLNMLLRCTGQNKVQLQLMLDELLQSEVICCRKRAGHEHFYFKHKLVRETIYNSIPKGLNQNVQFTLTQYSQFQT